MVPFPVNHKTIFVLDYTAYFAQSCKQPIEYDVQRSKASGFIPAAPICKSMWTCNVEAIQEYLRVVFDIYPREKQIKIVVGTNVFNEWNCPDLMNVSLIKFAHLGPPKTKQDSQDNSLLHGLSAAFDSLCQPTQQQSKRMEEGESIKNQGRIICLTAIKSESHIRSLEEFAVGTIAEFNKMAASNKTLPLDKCELTLVHSVPNDQDIKISERAMAEVTPQLSMGLHCSKSGCHIYNKLIWMCCQHFELTSTTVTGIPMKEEQNAHSSANYDVELLHPSAAHDEMFKSEHAEGLVIPSKEGLPIETAPLKWCTPKSSVIELHNCSAAYRICPVDVNSRPSSCLTNFLLSGRAVMLEQPRRSGAKVISHMLAAHGGEIFIHSIPTSRSLLEDPPSIIEGCGGRITDYRITAFGDFMKNNRLAPAPASVAENCEKKPYLTAMEHLERSSRFWPLTINETILFNVLTDLGPLPELLEKKTLTEEEVLECKKVVLGVVAMEARNDPLPVSTVGSRGKGPKRDEQYRQLWSELEALVSNFASTSENHEKVLACVHECKKPSQDTVSSPAATTSKKSLLPSKKEEVSVGLSASETSERSTTEREKKSVSQTERTFPGSPPKKMKTEELIMKPAGQSVLSMWSSKLQSDTSNYNKEFDGRLESEGCKTKLYIHLEEQSQEQGKAK